MENNENVIEWLTGQDEIAVTFTQQKYITKVRKLHAQSSELVPILVENKDGSIFAHLKIECLNLAPKRKVNMSEERKAELRERLAKMREAANG